MNTVIGWYKVRCDESGWHQDFHQRYYKTRVEWCEKMLETNTYYLRSSVYDDTYTRVLEPYYWMFKNEKDAVMFALRWP